jgi:hypothetical protein
MTKKIYLTGLTILVSLLTFAQANQGYPIPGIPYLLKSNGHGGKIGMGENKSTNGNNQIEFSITEKGDYTFTMKPTDGGPVKGVKVSLGKNPPGAIIKNIFTNEKGEVEFKGLEAGNYFIITERTTKEEPVKEAVPIKQTPKVIDKATTQTPTTTEIQAKTEQFVVNSCKSMVRQHSRAAVTQTTISTNGESTITITEKGDYTFFITPKNDTVSKTAKVRPIVRTTLCKNPPCPTKDLLIATPNEKGEIEYKNLEIGTYKISYVFSDNTNLIKTTEKAN